MGSISKPNTFSASTTISSSEVNDNFDTIYNEFNGSISAANLATGAVTTAKIADSNVTTAKIADANVTVAKVAATMGGGSAGTGAWDTWSPTLTNITQGSGTVVAKYMQVGKTVFYIFKFTLGAGSAVGTAPRFSLPVTLNSDWSANAQVPIGQAILFDNGTANHVGPVTALNTTTASIFGVNASVTYAREETPTATVPFTWTTNDAIYVTGSYEAA